MTSRYDYDMAAAELGTPPESTEADFRKAWRRAAQVAHPDKGGDPEVFKKKSAAWELIEGANFTRPPLPDLLDSLLQALKRRPGPAAGPLRGAGTASWGGVGPRTEQLPIILVSFQEVMCGGKRNILIPNWEHCTLTEDTPHSSECICHGTGWIRNEETQQGFTIPPGSGFSNGVRPQDTILRFRSFGAPVPGTLSAAGRAERGEYTLLIRWDGVRPPVVADTFLKNGVPVLRVRHPVDITQVWLQEEVKVTLPWSDEPYTVKILADRELYQFPGEGIPLLPSNRGCGDLEIELNVQGLGTPSEEERHLICQLRDLRVGRVKPTGA